MKHRYYDGGREAVVFRAVVEGKRLTCLVPREVLEDHLRVESLKTENSRLRAFDDSRDAVEREIRRRLGRAHVKEGQEFILPVGSL